jgi:CHRD domain
MTRVRVKLAIGVAVLGVAATTAAAIAGDGVKLRTGLSGFEEVPAVMTTGEGTFKARIDDAADEIRYELRYSGLEGGEVRQAHIHVGQQSVNGNIVVWFCGSSTNPGPAGTPTCPASPGTVTGTITPADVQSVPSQGFDPAGEFAELVRALRSGAAYANVHTARSTGGEIRGQILDRQDD